MLTLSDTKAFLQRAHGWPAHTGWALHCRIWLAMAFCDIIPAILTIIEMTVTGRLCLTVAKKGEDEDGEWEHTSCILLEICCASFEDEDRSGWIFEEAPCQRTSSGLWGVRTMKFTLLMVYLPPGKRWDDGTMDHERSSPATIKPKSFQRLDRTESTIANTVWEGGSTWLTLVIWTGYKHREIKIYNKSDGNSRFVSGVLQIVAED